VLSCQCARDGDSEWDSVSSTIGPGDAIADDSARRIRGCHTRCVYLGIQPAVSAQPRTKPRTIAPTASWFQGMGERARVVDMRSDTVWHCVTLCSLALARRSPLLNTPAC
jgi:hypothetical protein